jgi:predicted HicB family RNase H-like nuclease
MSEEIRDIKDSISFLAETQRLLSENVLLQQQQFNEFQQILNASREESEHRFNDFLEESRRNQQESERRLNDFLEEGRRNRQESERRFEASQTRLEAILLNQQRQMQLFSERQSESDQRFNVTLQEIRHIGQRVDQIEESP